MPNFIFELITHAPYRMILVNILIVFITSTILIGYRFVYPKKSISFFALLIIASLLPLISVFRPGSYESGDMTINAIKTISFANSLKDGQLVPRWSENLNATYGYPNFIFAYPLPYYLTALFSLLGISFINSVKALLILTFISSGIFMFIFLSSFLTKRSSFVGSITYLFAPYHLINLHFRVDIGEMTALAILPLFFYLIKNAHEKQNFLSVFLASVSFMLLILSHQAVALLGAPLAFFYSIFLGISDIKHFKEFLFRIIIPIFLLGLLFSSYYWLPVIYEAQFTSQIYQSSRSVSFLSLSEILFSKWRYGFLFQGPHGEIKPPLGYIGWLMFIIAIYLILKKKLINYKNLLIFLLCAFTFYTFMTLNLSKFIWINLPVLYKIQFSYRFLSIVIFISAMITSLVSECIKPKTALYLLVLFAVLSTILNWGNRGMVYMDDEVLKKELPLSTYQHEGLQPAAPKWYSGDEIWKSIIPDSHIEAVGGKIDVLKEKRTSVLHEYVVKTAENSYIRENTLYYPGWQLYIDGKKEVISYENPKHYGIITFPLTAGTHHVKLHFTNTTPRNLAIVMSASSFLIAGVALIKFSH